MRSEDVNTRILVRLWDVAEVSRRRAEAELGNRVDCTLKQFMILDFVESTVGNIRTTELARRLACSKPNVTQFLRELRARGWLTDIDEYGDKRGSILRVTETGRAAYASVARPLVDLAFIQLQGVDVEEKQVLAKVLRQLSLARWSW